MMSRQTTNSAVRSTPAVLQVTAGRVSGPSGVLLDDLSLKICGPSSIVVLGPVGVGKSALLCALSGLINVSVFERSGAWTLDTHPLPSDEMTAGVRWMPQAPYLERHATALPMSSGSASPGPAASGVVSSWREALAGEPRVVLLDEPPAQGAQAADLVWAVRAFVRKGLVVTVTHHLEQARAMADEILFIGNGKLQLHVSAEQFFSAPPTPQAEQFVKTGNCSWERPELALPKHFRWILDGQLAAMGLPGLNRDIDEDLASITERGIRHLVTLTRAPLPSERLRSHGLNSRQLAIADMGVPSVAAAAGVCADIERWLLAEQGVAVHCKAGLGRTGTIIACVLCWLGLSAEQAISRLRAVSRYYIQTEGQARFVRFFEGSYGGAGKRSAERLGFE